MASRGTLVKFPSIPWVQDERWKCHRAAMYIKAFDVQGSRV